MFSEADGELAPTGLPETEIPEHDVVPAGRLFLDLPFVVLENVVPDAAGQKPNI